MRGHGGKGVSRVQRLRGPSNADSPEQGRSPGKGDLRDRAVSAEGLGRRACVCSRLRPSRRQRGAHVPQVPVQLSEHI